MISMNKLDTETRAAVLTALVEGNSIASTCRMFGVNKITVLRLLADAGTLAAQFHDTTVYDVPAKRVQMDEIWSYCYAKHDNITHENYAEGRGDVWTWVAMDADTKLAISWYVGNRGGAAASLFVSDLADRLTDRVQLTSDGWAPYRAAILKAFGTDVDYAMLIKNYADHIESERRYSPPVVTSIEKIAVQGNPDERHISTSYVERQNLTMRMQMRRFTRLTNAFSKKIENHKHSIALHYFHYNFCRRHQAIQTTPAVMAGLTSKIWTMVDFVKLLEREEDLMGGRLTTYKPSKVIK
jgi:IS1 family transposase